MAEKSKSKMNLIMDEIFYRIKNNKEILKILYYDKSDVDVYEQPDLPLPIAQNVIKTRIFEREKVPLKEEMLCYITMFYGDKTYHHRRNIFYNGNTFNIIICCHNDIVWNDYIGSRVEETEHIIEELFDGENIGTTCRCEVVNSVRDSVKGTDYCYRHITLSFSDFNR